MENNFPNPRKETFIKVRDKYRTPNRKDHERSTQHNITNSQSTNTVKERTLNATREKDQVTYKGKNIRITADSFSETKKVRRVCVSVTQL